jgi:hypothetical protein
VERFILKEKGGTSMMRIADCLPDTVWARTKKNDEGSFDVYFSAAPPKHVNGETFQTVGKFVLADLYICGSGFRLKLSQEEKEANTEPSKYKSLKEKEKWAFDE